MSTNTSTSTHKFNLRLPTNNQCIGTYVNGNKAYKVYFKNISSGIPSYYHYINTPEWITDLNSTRGINICNFEISSQGDWNIVDYLPEKVVFELIVQYFETDISRFCGKEEIQSLQKYISIKSRNTAWSDLPTGTLSAP